LIIDANVYLGSWPYWRMDTKTADSLGKVVKSNGIDRALISSLKSVFYHADDGNQEVLAACKKYSDNYCGLATLTPLSDPKGPGYQELRTGEFKGIRIYPQHHSFSLSDARKIYQLAEEVRVPVVICFRLIMSWSLPSLSIDEVLAVVRQYPKVKFVLSGFNYEILGVLLARLFPPNLYVETSGLQIAGGVEMLTQTLGPDHVMLGTGLPVQFPQSGIQKVLNAKLDRKQLEAVKWENAAALFKIS
jgi:predicted TIM-barrel fold metal-dependent hydrolase